MPIYNTVAISPFLGPRAMRYKSILLDSVFLRMRDVPSSAVFCSSLILMLPGICLVYFSKPFIIIIIIIIIIMTQVVLGPWKQ